MKFTADLTAVQIFSADSIKSARRQYCVPGSEYLSAAVGSWGWGHELMTGR